MPIILYYMPHSSPCRSVMLLAKHLGITLNLKLVKLCEGEHLASSCTEINPQYTVPTIDDDGFTLWESRTIMTYLVSKYAKNDSLYPTDPMERAVVDQHLFFDIGVLYKSIVDYYGPVILRKVNQPSEEYLSALEKSLEFLNEFLQNIDYVAGYLTVADYAIVVNVCTIIAFGFDIDKYQNIVTWYERCKVDMAKDGFKEVNEEPAKVFAQFYLKNLKSDDSE